MFESIQPQSRRKRLVPLIVSMFMHICIISLIVLIPLIFFNKLPDLELITFLYQPPNPPPPPPPPPPPAAAVSRPRPIIAQFSAPTQIPKSIPPPDNTEAPVVDKNLVNSMNLGIPGGVPGGVPGGIPGGILSKQLPLPPPPKPVEEPAPAPKPKPIFVGGSIQEAKLIYKEPAQYPPLALKARIQGVVLLRVTVDEEGKVSDIKVISGHPLLIPAAVTAVSHWKYKPTIFNGHPWPVIATVAVNFMLQ